MSADTAFVAKGKGLQKQGAQKSGTLAMSAASPPTAAIEADREIHRKLQEQTAARGEMPPAL
jgi:hypothetical protein